MATAAARSLGTALRGHTDFVSSKMRMPPPMWGGGGGLRKIDAVFGRRGRLFRKGPFWPLIKTAGSPPLLYDPLKSRDCQNLIWRAAW